MLLEAVRVKGFRSLRELDWVPLYNITILTGGNDTGKSSFVDAINLPFDDRSRVSEQDFSRFGSEQAGEIVIEGRLRLNAKEIEKLNQATSNAADFVTGNCLHVRRVFTKDGNQSLEAKKMVCTDAQVLVLMLLLLR